MFCMLHMLYVEYAIAPFMRDAMIYVQLVIKRLKNMTRDLTIEEYTTLHVTRVTYSHNAGS